MRIVYPRILIIAFIIILVTPIEANAGGPSAGKTGVPDTGWYNTDTDGFKIDTADQLAGLSELVNQGNNFSGKTVTLGADIDLNAYGKGYRGGEGWIPIGGTAPEKVFCGTFDGGGKTIENLYIDSDIGCVWNNVWRKEVNTGLKHEWRLIKFKL